MECVYVLTYSVIFNSFVTPWAVAHQDLLFMGFSRQEYWNGLPFPPPGDLPDPGISLQPRGLYSPWNSPGKNTGVGSLSLLQGIFLTQGSNSCLLCWQADSLPLSHQGSTMFCVSPRFFLRKTLQAESRVSKGLSA